MLSGGIADPSAAAISTAMPAGAIATAPVTAGATPPRGRFLVGDSLSVSVAAMLRSRGFVVNARPGRQFSTAPAVVRGLGDALPRNVIIALGTNGTIAVSDCRAVVRAAGKQRRVFLVTNRMPRSWQKPNRRTVRTCNRSFAGPRVRVINWYRHSAGQAGWFASDRVHLSAAGRRAFTDLIDGFVDDVGLR